MEKSRICFVVPEYDKATPTHFNYLYDFIKVISKDLDVFLFVEKKSGLIYFQSEAIKVYYQKFTFLPFRFLENFLMLLIIRLSGYKDFYIHYSFLSGFNASLIVKLLFGRTFYWNCGLPWKYQRSAPRDLFERTVYKLISFLVTGTEGLKKQYADNYQLPLSKIKVMSNWIDIENFKKQLSGANIKEIKEKLDIPENYKIVFFAHRLSKRKGAQYLPSIFKALENEKVFFVVAGDGPEKENLKIKISSFGLENRIKILGWVPQNEIVKYLAVSDVFIMPSEEEGFPHVLLEAMAAGKPFVAFNVGGVKEIISSELGEFIVDLENEANFINKIKELLNDREKYLKFNNVSKEWVKRYDINNVAEQFKDLLK